MPVRDVQAHAGERVRELSSQREKGCSEGYALVTTDMAEVERKDEG